jgi:hypothetical protein
MSTGLSEDISDLHEINSCEKCGKPRSFKCPKCGLTAKMMRVKGNQ